MAQTTEQSKQEVNQKRTHESLNFIKTIHLKHNLRINDFTQPQKDKKKKKALQSGETWIYHDLNNSSPRSEHKIVSQNRKQNAVSESTPAWLNN